MAEKENLQIADNVVVSMDYNLTVDSEIIDTTDHSEPIQFIQGHGNIIPGLEKELHGLKIGDNKKVIVQPAEAYGEFDENAFTDVSKDQFPADFEIRPGGEIRVRTVSGQFISAIIESADDEMVKLNLNHPLAGKELLFDAKIVNLRTATEEEISNGRLGGGCSSCSGGDCNSGCC
ncbi:MAG: peptidylprolyl isomerase [Anaerolineaceae bacterium]|nr:peptidylprolyl isomerase [Anaerolineaceae bacterium]